jgi:Fe-S cluster biosynthesis and repair protein YggX
MGIMIMHQMTQIFAEYLDLRNMPDEAVDALFEDAKKELMESEAWSTYWRGHIGHLSLMIGGGTLQDELAKDAEEVERQLLDLNNYLYNQWDESPEAFGRALKESDMSDDEMLRMLFLLAKKAALENEGETPDLKLQKMRSKVKEYADQLFELVDDKYDYIYNKVWEDIVQNAIIGSQLSKFRTGRHNDGFNMQCFCHIVGWMSREYHMFGSSNSPADLGKKLGDKYSQDTLKDYIKKTKTMLTAQSISELDTIVKKHLES